MSIEVKASIVQARSSRRPGLVGIAVLLTMVAAPACQGYFHTKTGEIMSSYAEQHMVPHMMASGDLSMACETGVSMGGFLMSFERVTDHPGRAALVTLLAAGMCAEADAWEADLRRLRALRAGQASEARDARIAEQRGHALAAERFYAAFHELESVFGRPGEGCPELADEDELFYFLGLAAGLMAVLHDRAAEGLAGVPMDIPQLVARAASCLDNERWWSGPLALQASVWAMVPGSAPEGADPLATLALASQDGEAQGVRLARAFQVQILDASGYGPETREAIAAHATSLANSPSQPDWRLLDYYATRMILHISDRIWTDDRGHRTPLNALGTFWQPPVETEEYEDLFEDLLEDLDEGEGEEAPSDATPNETETEEDIR